MCRYFEGQLASISEGDDELDVEASPVKVTEAAKKVLGSSIYLYDYFCLFFSTSYLITFSTGFFA